MHKVPNLQCSAFNFWNVKMHNIMTVFVFITEAFHILMSQEIVAM